MLKKIEPYMLLDTYGKIMVPLNQIANVLHHIVTVEENWNSDLKKSVYKLKEPERPKWILLDHDTIAQMVTEARLAESEK